MEQPTVLNQLLRGDIDQVVLSSQSCHANPRAMDRDNFSSSWHCSFIDIMSPFSIFMTSASVTSTHHWLPVCQWPNCLYILERLTVVARNLSWYITAFHIMGDTNRFSHTNILPWHQLRLQPEPKKHAFNFNPACSWVGTMQPTEIPSSPVYQAPNLDIARRK